MAKTGLTRNYTSASLSMPAGSSLSASVIVAGFPIVSLMMPASWDSASLSFDVAACVGGTFFPLYDDAGTEVAIPTGASRAIANATRLEKLGVWAAFRIRSGCGVASVVDQGGARTFITFLEG